MKKILTKGMVVAGVVLTMGMGNSVNADLGALLEAANNDTSNTEETTTATGSTLTEDKTKTEETTSGGSLSDLLGSASPEKVVKSYGDDDFIKDDKNVSPGLNDLINNATITANVSISNDYYFNDIKTHYFRVNGINSNVGIEVQGKGIYKKDLIKINKLEDGKVIPFNQYSVSTLTSDVREGENIEGKKIYVKFLEPVTEVAVNLKGLLKGNRVIVFGSDFSTIEKSIKLDPEYRNYRGASNTNSTKTKAKTTKETIPVTDKSNIKTLNQNGKTPVIEITLPKGFEGTEVVVNKIQNTGIADEITLPLVGILSIIFTLAVIRRKQKKII